jgi:ABC-type Zn uptake system ZnuABC Zn-binding protein ZnuA
MRCRPVALHLLALSLLVALTATGCSGGNASSSTTAASGSSGGGRLKVVATTTQVTDFARQVGGDAVDVYGVLKPNVDPHDFDPAPADLQAIAEADVIVKNGIGLEGWFDKTIDAAQPKGHIVDTSAGVPLRRAEGDDASGGADDPHIWQNPRLAKTMVENIEKAFEQADPGRAAVYQANLAAYTRQLDDLDREIAAQVDSLSNKKLVTNHDAFHYYVDRYGLEFVGSIIPSFDTSAELSVAEREILVTRVKEQHVKAVFSESSLPPKTADAIAQEAGVKIVQGDDSLYGDSLGPEGSEGATYVSMLRHNTRVIVDNLR